MISIDPLVGQVTLGIYAILLVVGGLIGYLKAGSRPSLIAGMASALAALAALVLSVRNIRWGVPLGMILSIALFLLFGYRYAVKTRKFMPSGLLAVVSLVVLAAMFLVMDWTGP
ncbi:MAG: TMEM14 family protein [Isosphaerales bacterium]